MARKKGARTSQQKRFQRAAKHCWTELRAGRLPQRGMFKSCMRKQLKKR